MSRLTRASPPCPAPGGPGIAPTWTSSAKDMIGCALGPSRVWFTSGYGIVNEVYYPRVDLPQVRDLGFIVADGAGFWVEAKRIGDYAVSWIAEKVPGVTVVHRHERFALQIRAIVDPDRDVLLVDLHLEGDPALAPYVLLAPRLAGSGTDNVARVCHLGTRRVLVAERSPFGLALAAADEEGRDAIGAAGAGYVGETDGWQDFAIHGRMTRDFTEAGPGNVALMASVSRRASLALGFGSTAQAAATLAVSSLFTSFEERCGRQTADWLAWHGALAARRPCEPAAPPHVERLFEISLTVLRTMRDQTYPGTMVASLSVPWGNTRDDRAGYHLVWPRDLVASAGALFAAGASDEALDSLRYLAATQDADGHWQQNQWLGGTPHWTGVQLDETAAPVLLADMLAEHDALDGVPVADMTRRALSFLAANGPASPQDRWEENAGLNAFTLAFVIAALVAGSRFLAGRDAETALDLADFWNASLEDWLSVRDTPLDRLAGAKGHFVRVAPRDAIADPDALHRPLELKNRPSTAARIPVDAEVSTDFLQLVRFGLRRPDDPLVEGSLAIVDLLLKADTPAGPAWRRYNGDRYGEHDDGSAYDGGGRGRAWPLLTGERGHFELVAGHDPIVHLEAMAAMAGRPGLLPEQVWDGPAIPERRLAPGRPTGAAMPLAWAHAEFVKLAVSRRLGRPFDRPERVWRRYGGRRPMPRRAYWMPHAPIGDVPERTDLVIALPRPALVHWSVFGWREPADERTTPGGLGLFCVTLPFERFGDAPGIVFTWRWEEDGTWTGRDVVVAVRRAPAGSRQPAAPSSAPSTSRPARGS